VESMEEIELFRNKRTKKYFIRVADVGKDKVNLIDPNSKIITLERDIFDEPVEGDARDFLSSGDVTREQVDLYREKILSMEADTKAAEKRKAQEAWEEMTNKQREIIFSTAWKKASPSVQEEVKLILGNLGVDL
jgi:hypothetical protein